MNAHPSPAHPFAVHDGLSPRYGTSPEPAAPWERVERFHRGQLVLRRRDESVRRVVEHDPMDDTYLLDDGLWVTARDIEDPLVASRRRELQRSAEEAARRRAIARGDFGAVFPGVAIHRPARASLFSGASLGWMLAAAEGAALAMMVLQQL